LAAFRKTRAGFSLIYVTHHVEEILPLFRKILLLREGRIIASGETAEVLSAQTMQQLYGVSLQLLRKNGRYWPIPEEAPIPSPA